MASLSNLKGEQVNTYATKVGVQRIISGGWHPSFYFHRGNTQTSLSEQHGKETLYAQYDCGEDDVTSQVVTMGRDFM